MGLIISSKMLLDEEIDKKDFIEEIKDLLSDIL